MTPSDTIRSHTGFHASAPAPATPAGPSCPPLAPEGGGRGNLWPPSPPRLCRLMLRTSLPTPPPPHTG